jgi:hypothetical protein
MQYNSFIFNELYKWHFFFLLITIKARLVRLAVINLRKSNDKPRYRPVKQTAKYITLWNIIQEKYNATEGLSLNNDSAQ